MIDISKPLQTRAGYPVTLLVENSGDSCRPFVGLVERPGGDKRLSTWGPDGLFYPRGHPFYGRRPEGSMRDLVNAPEPEVIRFSKLSGDPENGGVKLGLWRKKAPKLGPQDTGILKLTCVDGVPVSAEIVK